MAAATIPATVSSRRERAEPGQYLGEGIGWQYGILSLSEAIISDKIKYYKNNAQKPIPSLKSYNLTIILLSNRR